MADSKLIQKTVLIIGYGTAGSKVCAQLAKNKHVFNFDILLINEIPCLLLKSVYC